MKIKDRIEQKIAETKSALATYAGIDGPDDAATEQYKKDLSTLATLNDQLAAAIAAEAEGEPEDPEGKETTTLADKVSLGRYAQAAVTGRLDGAEAEYNASLGINHQPPNGGVMVPWQLHDDETAEIEKYAVSETTADTRGTERQWADRVFAGMVSGWLFGSPEMLPAGTASFPITTAGATVTGSTDKNSKIEATTMTFEANELKPKRIGPAGAVWNNTDLLRVPGLESATRRMLRASLMDGIEAFCLGQITAGTTALQIDGTADGAESDATTSAEMETALVGAIDGRLSMDVSGLKMVSAPEVGSYFHGLTKVYSGSESEALSRRFSDLGISWMWSDHFSVLSDAGEYYLWIVKPMHIKDAFRMVLWNAYSLTTDPYTLADSDEVRWFATAHADAKVIRSESILRRRVAIS